MPRPKKCRKVGCLPAVKGMRPMGIPTKDCGEPIVMTVDEYETIRLMDFEDLTQAQCAEKMEVARTTVTAIYIRARKKIARALVEARLLMVEGGEFILCHRERCCKRELQHMEQKEEDKMKIAVTYENGNVFGHFGHTEAFKLYDVENKEIVKSEVVDTQGNGHGGLVGFLKDRGVDTLICGGLGAGAKNALLQAGIVFYGGVNGNVDDAVTSFLKGELNYNPNEECNHHHHGEEDGHHYTCGHGHQHTCAHH